MTESTNIPSTETLVDAAEYYRENSFGYGSLKSYVETDFPYLRDPSEIEHVVSFIREYLGL